MNKWTRAFVAVGITLLPILLVAQIPGNAPPGTVFGNSGAASAPGRFITGTAWFDRWCGSTAGHIARRDGSSWACATLGSLVSAGTNITIDVTSGLPTIRMADMANARVKCRTTAGTGIPEDCTGAQTTALLSNVVGDSGAGGTKGLVPAPGAGDAAAGKFLKADGTFSVPPGTGGGMSSLPGGRLTLTSGVSVTTSDVVGTTVYYAPFIHPFVPIYDGANMTLKQFTASATDAVGLSVVLGANWTVNDNYDFFAGLNSSVVTLCSGPSWLAGTGGTATVRGTGAGSTEIQLYNGVWTNKNSMTCRYSNTQTFTCAVNQCTLLGTARMSGSGQTSDTMAFRWVSNAYNAIARPMRVVEPASSWTYTTAVFRQANNNTANQLDFVQTLSGGKVNAIVYAMFSNSGAGPFASVGIDIDTVNTTALINNINFLQYSYAANNLVGQSAVYVGFPGLGRRIAIWKEYSQASGTTTWYGNAGGTILANGIFGEVIN